MVDQKPIEAEVAGLRGLSLAQLRQRWERLFGAPPPKSLRERFLVKACAYQIQAKAHGGLSAAAKRRLRKVAEDVSAGRPVAIAPPRRIKAGARLVRAWGGAVHTVTVTASGFDYGGARYGSLSAIAKAITGSHQNGPAFFGLERPTRGAQGPDKAGTRSQGGGDGGECTSTGPGGAGTPAQELEVTDNG